MPQIISAEYDRAGCVIVVFEGQKPDTVITVPPDPTNKDYVELMEWAALGNEIKTYVAPPPPPPQPTIEDLMQRIAELEKRLNG